MSSRKTARARGTATVVEEEGPSREGITMGDLSGSSTSKKVDYAQIAKDEMAKKRPKKTQSQMLNMLTDEFSASGADTMGFGKTRESDWLLGVANVTRFRDFNVKATILLQRSENLGIAMHRLTQEYEEAVYYFFSTRRLC